MHGPNLKAIIPEESPPIGTLQQLLFRQKKHSMQISSAESAAQSENAILLAAVICVLLTSLLTVQAAGIDVFGAIARWTTELFSFGKTEERRWLGR